MEWTLTLRVFTPLVMAGAEQQGLAEWRAASVKGVVRWWFRIAGGSRSDEERLFGAVGQGGARASLLTVETPPVSRSQTLNRLPAPYFGFSIRMNRRGVIPAGEALSVTFRVSPWADEADVDRIRAAVWLAFYLGNFGTRSRKGYGSLVVTESTDPFFEALPPSAEQMATVYRQKIKSAISTISPSSCRMKGVWLVRRSWGDMEEEYRAMRRAMGVPDKAYLGYPFHKCRSCSEPSDPEWSADRFASPLIIKPLADDIAVLTAIDVPTGVRQAFRGQMSPQFRNFAKEFNKFIRQLSPQRLWP
jgi:CRISPR type III-B/RAMP module RAMP protein Cmr1